MKKKLLAILGSVRFWTTLVGAVVYYLSTIGVLTPALADTILGLLGTSVVIRTVDKFR
jgi:uncharacterized membrane protein YbaN (DUF454 family)